jgi:hypothetical protein
LPYAFSQADSASGARMCIEQYESVGMSEHDETTIAIMEEFSADLNSLASGCCPSEAWQEEHDAICTATWDESAGEGYHRSSHLAKLHAPGATAQWIKQSVRLKENLALSRRFARHLGREGRQVFRYEWHHHMRLLRVQQRLWTRVKMRPSLYYQRIYRMDEMAQEDWSQYVTMVGAVVVPKQSDESVSELLAREYTTALFQPLQYYRFPETREVIGQDGGIEQVTAMRSFQLIRINVGSARTHTIQTFQSKTDKSLTSKLALYVLQFC